MLNSYESWMNGGTREFLSCRRIKHHCRRLGISGPCCRFRWKLTAVDKTGANRGLDGEEAQASAVGRGARRSNSALRVHVNLRMGDHRSSRALSHPGFEASSQRQFSARFGLFKTAVSGPLQRGTSVHLKFAMLEILGPATRRARDN